MPASFSLEGNEMPTSKNSPTAGEISQGDVPTETNFPTAPEAIATEEAKDMSEPKPEPGEVWAIYTGMQPSQRTLTVADLKQLGDSKASESLVWDRNNRFRREVSGVHPMVLDYIENLDGNFKVVRPE
jgi:hypothetical protein